MYLRVVCLVDWHLEVFYCPYYKIKNARMHELNFMHPNIYYRTFIYSIYTGDEGIEPPPKVLETPIIPFDQSPSLKFQIHIIIKRSQLSITLR